MASGPCGTRAGVCDLGSPVLPGLAPRKSMHSRPRSKKQSWKYPTTGLPESLLGLAAWGPVPCRKQRRFRTLPPGGARPQRLKNANVVAFISGMELLNSLNE